MRKATREALTLAISANAAAVAARAVAEAIYKMPGCVYADARANDLDWEADRYWLRLANTLRRTK